MKPILFCAVIVLSLSLVGMESPSVLKKFGYEVNTNDEITFKVRPELGALLGSEQQKDSLSLQCNGKNFAIFVGLAKIEAICREKKQPLEKGLKIYWSNISGSQKDLQEIEYCAQTFGNERVKKVLGTVSELIIPKELIQLTDEKQVYPSILAMHDYGDQLLLATDLCMRRWNEEPEKEVPLYDYHQAHVAAFSNSGEWFFVVQKDGNARVIENPDKDRPRIWNFEDCCDALPKAIALDNTGRAFIVGNRALGLIEIKKKTILLRDSHLPFSTIATTGDGTRLFLSTAGDIIQIFDVKDKKYGGQLKTNFPLLGTSGSLQIGAEDKCLYSAHIGRIIVSDIEQKKEVGSYCCKGLVHAAQYEPDNLIAGVSKEGCVTVWDSRIATYPIKKWALNIQELSGEDHLHSINGLSFNGKRFVLGYSLYKIMQEREAPLGLVTNHVAVVDMQNV